MNRKGLMNKKIPTALGLLILVGGLIAGVILVNTRTNFEPKAGPTESPKNIKVTNRGSNTYSLSWTTDTPMTGYVKYSEDPAKINLPAGDVRDQISGTSQNYTNHYANITGLSPNKTYYFLIGSGSQTYNDNGKPYQVRTLTAASLPAEEVASGKITNPDASPVNGAIVFLDIDGAETLSTITKNDGTWRLNISNARSKDGKALSIDPKTTTISLFVQAGSSGTATAITNTEKSKPVPDIVMGKNQNFIDGQLTTLVETPRSGSSSAGFAINESQLSAPIVPLSSTNSELVTFLNPAIDGELIATNTPELKVKLATGSGLVLKIGTLSSDGLLKQNEAGEWVWTPTDPLGTGIQTLTAEFLDGQNKKQSVTRNFNVLAIGDIGGLPAFTATPSATPTLAEITPEPTEATTMPETDSENLTDSGTFEQSMIGVAFGLILFLIGRDLKKRWKHK